MKKTTKGVLWIVLPMLLLPVVLFMWGLISFVLTSAVAAGEPSANAPMILRIFNIVLGGLGLISFVMVPVGFIIGLVTLLKKDPEMSASPSSMPLTAPPSDTPNMMQ